MKPNWEPKKISEFVQQANNDIVLIPTETYSLLGMRLEGRGLFIREQKQGGEIGSKSLNKVVPGEFIYSRLFAWKGAFDFVKNDFDGCYVSDEYPCFAVDEKQVDAKFLHYYFSQSKVWKEVEQYCIGVTKASRNRFKEKYFLNFEIKLPSVKEQQYIVSVIDRVEQRIEKIKQLRTEQTENLNNLLFSKYVELIKNVEWLSMKDIAPIIRREVKLVEEELYPELGIRSFGKGTFHKPALTGLEVATKKIFQIKKGDLLFSNVFAWEGGIAVAKEEDNDRYGSHRFISCLVNKEKVLEEYLCFHFLSPKGLEDINACSPGGAGRNKTLGLDKLMKIKVPVPDVTLQKDFVELLHKIQTIKEQHNEIDKELTQLMPALLDKAFSGNL
jgi:type I restriction enzyme, S subunit